jgi:hypothetical protein
VSVESTAYYRAALVTLAVGEARKPTQRRFGPDADALWKGVAGDLTAADRIDLLLRDANAQWPDAFAPRKVFSLAGVAEDEAFGPDWAPLDPVDAEDLWRSITKSAPASDAVGALGQIAAAWNLEIAPTDPPSVLASDHLVVAGPSAVAALAKRFADAKDLDWAAQVVCVATSPAHRQIAASAVALLNLTKSARVVGAADAVDVKPGAKRFVSGDAEEADAARAKDLAAQ